MSAAEPIKWRYGARMRGRWLWPRGLWEYDIDKAKVAALRTFPHASAIGVEPLPPATGDRWVHEHNKGWRIEQPPEPIAPPAIVDQWWQRD